MDKDVQPPQLKKAYYALAAAKCTLDKRPGDEQAKADFLALKKAYDILSDPVRRRRYDRTGSVEDDADFAAAYEHYRGIPVSEEDIRATEAEYRHSDEERTDVVEYASASIFAGSRRASRILESIIGSTDDDAERYRAILEDALRAGDLPKKYKKPIAKATILTLAELEADAEEMSSSEEDDDDDEKVDLAPPAEVATARAAAASDEPSSDLLAMFASRRAERQRHHAPLIASVAAKPRADVSFRGGGRGAEEEVHGAGRRLVSVPSYNSESPLTNSLPESAAAHRSVPNLSASSSARSVIDGFPAGQTAPSSRWTQAAKSS